MNINEWNKLNPSEQYYHVLTTPKKIAKMSGIDGSAKVGETEVVTGYRVEVGELYLNEWDQDLANALRESADTIDHLRAKSKEYEEASKDESL